MGRFINADSVVAGVGGSLQGYNMFAYCFNNPVNLSDASGCWPTWLKNTIKKVTTKVIKPISNFVKKTFSKVDLTYSNGLNISGTPSGFIYNLQAGLYIDTKGNMAVQGSYGAGITTGNPGISATSYQSVTNAPSIDKLNGFGCQVGGSCGFSAGPVPVAVGGDLSFSPDSRADTTYIGWTRNVGVGTPGLEFHVEMSNTGTEHWKWVQINIFDEIDGMCAKIKEW